MSCNASTTGATGARHPNNSHTASFLTRSAHIASWQRACLRQYLYFCTSKAGKLSTAYETSMTSSSRRTLLGAASALRAVPQGMPARGASGSTGTHTKPLSSCRNASSDSRRIGSSSLASLSSPNSAAWRARNASSDAPRFASCACLAVSALAASSAAAEIERATLMIHTGLVRSRGDEA